MGGFAKFVVSGILIVIALVLFPFVHLGTSSVDTTGFLPINISILALLPYAFVGALIYVIIKMK